ncbi:MAG TPA: 3-hydroxyacyl-CoA dehydrogenase NAD-binding domain-containing protein [Chitinophagaceae bacterium]
MQVTLTAMTIDSICVCGAGTMGSGIAQVMAMAGYPTILYELNEAVLSKAKQSINHSLDKLVEKNKLKEEEASETLNRIVFTRDIRTCQADLVIEAIIENMDAKVSLFQQLDTINNDHTIFTSNTSSLSITDLGKRLRNPGRVAGLHFFNPAQLMKLVEVVRTEDTKQEVVDTLVEITKKAGKNAIVCKDSPGFIVNRVARPYYIESLRLAEEGIADFATIDALLENQGFKMGPFKLMDLIGNDVNYAVSCSVYDQLEQPERLKPSYIQKDKVEKGELGKKTGKGYYDYQSNQ